MPINFGHLESAKTEIHGTKRELSSLCGEWIDREPLRRLSEETIAAVFGVSKLLSLDIEANGWSTTMVRKRRLTRTQLLFRH